MLFCDNNTDAQQFGPVMPGGEKKKLKTASFLLTTHVYTSEMTEETPLLNFLKTISWINSTQQVYTRYPEHL